MPAEHDPRARGVEADQARHLARLGEVRRDEGDPDEVVPVPELADEALAAREVEDGDVRVDVLGEEVEAERAVMEPERGGPLRLRHLVVEELHDVLSPAPGVVDAEWTEDPREQDAAGCPLGAAGHVRSSDPGAAAGPEAPGIADRMRIGSSRHGRVTKGKTGRVFCYAVLEAVGVRSLAAGGAAGWPDTGGRPLRGLLPLRERSRIAPTNSSWSFPVWSA